MSEKASEKGSQGPAVSVVCTHCRRPRATREDWVEGDAAQDRGDPVALAGEWRTDLCWFDRDEWCEVSPAKSPAPFTSPALDEADALADAVERVYLSRHTSHIDRTGGSGLGCEACKGDRATMDKLRASAAAYRRARGGSKP